MSETHLYTKDHPEAGDRTPQVGEVEYRLLFPLQDGGDLVVHCGRETLERFSEMLGSMLIDEAYEEK